MQRGVDTAIQVCALCLKPGLLQDSHVIPNFSIRRLRFDSPSGYVRSTSSINRRDGAKPVAKLLCGECEQRFSRLETEFANLVYHPLRQSETAEFKCTDKVHGFAASLAWRAIHHEVAAAEGNYDVSTYDWHGYDDLRLAEMVLREALLNSTACPDWIEHHLLQMSAGNTILPEILRLTQRAVGLWIAPRPPRSYIVSLLGVGIVVVSILRSGSTDAPWPTPTRLVDGAIVRPGTEYFDALFLAHLKTKADEADAAFGAMSDKQQQKVQDAAQQTSHLSIWRSIPTMEMMTEQAISQGHIKPNEAVTTCELCWTIMVAPKDKVLAMRSAAPKGQRMWIVCHTCGEHVSALDPVSLLQHALVMIARHNGNKLDVDLDAELRAVHVEFWKGRHTVYDPSGRGLTCRKQLRVSSRPTFNGASVVFCSQCGSSNFVRARFCSSCLTALTKENLLSNPVGESVPQQNRNGRVTVSNNSNDIANSGTFPMQLSDATYEWNGKVLYNNGYDHFVLDLWHPEKCPARVFSPPTPLGAICVALPRLPQRKSVLGGDVRPRETPRPIYERSDCLRIGRGCSTRWHLAHEIFQLGLAFRDRAAFHV